jgi:hypothetical protein
VSVVVGVIGIRILAFFDSLIRNLATIIGPYCPTSTPKRNRVKSSDDFLLSSVRSQVPSQTQTLPRKRNPRHNPNTALATSAHHISLSNSDVPSIRNINKNKVLPQPLPLRRNLLSLQQIPNTSTQISLTKNTLQSQRSIKGRQNDKIYKNPLSSQQSLGNYTSTIHSEKPESLYGLSNRSIRDEYVIHDEKSSPHVKFQKDLIGNG